MKTLYLVWNSLKTECFGTFDKQLAYEVRKGADSNCYDIHGNKSEMAISFCEQYSHHEDCSISEIKVLT